MSQPPSPPTPAQPGGWAAAGAGTPNAAYRTQSVKYTPTETSLDESVTFKSLLLIALRATIISGALQSLCVLLWLITELTNADSGLPGGFAIPTILSGGTLASGLLFWVLLLFTEENHPLGEWKILIEDKAAAATSAYAAIYGTLNDRRIPVRAQARRIRTDILNREVVNSRLVIVDSRYFAYISVFAYGTGLYVGWTMWRRRRSFWLMGVFLKDVVGSLIGRTDDIKQMLRTEKVRAMREAVHAAVREGAEVAMRDIDVPLASTFGFELPIQDIDQPASLRA